MDEVLEKFDVDVDEGLSEKEVEERIESEIKVLKRDGNREAFNSQKVEDSCAKAGAPVSVAKNIATQIEKQVVDGATTEEIRDMVLEKLGNIEENGLKGGKATGRKKNEFSN